MVDEKLYGRRRFVEEAEEEMGLRGDRGDQSAVGVRARARGELRA
jgi:hypothetical protein